MLIVLLILLLTFFTWESGLFNCPTPIQQLELSSAGVRFDFSQGCVKIFSSKDGSYTDILGNVI